MTVTSLCPSFPAGQLTTQPRETHHSLSGILSPSPSLSPYTHLVVPFTEAAYYPSTAALLLTSHSDDLGLVSQRRLLPPLPDYTT